MTYETENRMQCLHLAARLLGEQSQNPPTSKEVIDIAEELYKWLAGDESTN